MDLHRHDRLHKAGGGLGLYARSDFTVTELSKSDPSDHNIPEYIIYRIKSDTFTLLFAIVYRPPSTRLPISFLDNIAKFIPLYSHVIITGDFNINMLSPNDNATLFRRHFSDKSLHLVDSPPTHHTYWSDGSSHHSWLDLFLIKDTDRLVAYRKSPAPFTGCNSQSGHDLIEIDYSINTAPPPSQQISTRNLKHLRSSDVASILAPSLINLPAPCFHFADAQSQAQSQSQSQSQSYPLAATHIDDYTLKLSQTILSTFDTLAPIRSFTASVRNKPWVTPDIRRHIAERQRLCRRARRTGTYHAIAAYRAKRNIVSNLLATAKNNFIATRIASVPSVSGKWRELHKLGLASQKTRSPLQHFTPETLNAHYAAVCSASPPLTPDDVTAACNESPSRPDGPTFDFSPISAEQITSALSTCSSNCLGTDGISPHMIQLSLPLIVPHLLSLFNSSLATGHFPSNWKHAIIVPLAKTPSPQSPSDTRPIALLCSLSKIFERIVHKQLFSYLLQHNFLDPRQSGFTPLHSTQTALLGILDYVRRAIDAKKVVGFVAFDFSKAFDSLPHSLILLKLRRVGCSPGVIRWFASYLSNRSQSIRTEDGTPSESLALLTGVPQGSVLGPLLFLIFVLDMPLVLNHAIHGLFCDDLQIYLEADPTPEGLVALAANLSRDATAISNWAQANGLKLNPDKSVALLFGHPSYLTSLQAVTTPSIKIADTIIPYANKLKCLGIILSPSLNWDEHLGLISARVYASLHSLRHYKHALSRSLRKELVEALIFPHFDYCCAVYHDLSGQQNLKLHRLLNSCVRYVFGNIPWQSHVTPYRIALGWLSVLRRREYFIGSQAHSIIKTGSPSFLHDRFVPRSSRPDIRRSTRVGGGYFILPNARTEILRNSFPHCAAHLINSLGRIDLQDASTASFKTLLFSTLLERDRSDWVERSHREGLPTIPSQIHSSLILPKSLLPRL